MDVREKGGELNTRLIDADKLNLEMYERVMNMSGYHMQGFEIARGIVNNQEADYDIDTVIKKLKKKSIENLGITENQFMMDSSEYSSYCSLCLSDVLEIVRNGKIRD